MEKNQHNSSGEAVRQQSDDSFTGNQPGQQPPVSSSQTEENGLNVSTEKEQHSESSFPQQEGETLGTP